MTYNFFLLNDTNNSILNNLAHLIKVRFFQLLDVAEVSILLTVNLVVLNFVI